MNLDYPEGATPIDPDETQGFNKKISLSGLALDFILFILYIPVNS